MIADDRRATRIVGSGLLLFVLTGCSSASGVPVPVRWGDGSGAVVTLREDGRGELVGVPYGAGPGCDSNSFEFLDGELEWEEVSPGRIEIAAGESTVTLWADLGGFGADISWDKVILDPCGERTADDQKVMYTRYEKFDGSD